MTLDNEDKIPILKNKLVYSKFLCESKVLQCFAYVRHDSDDFDEVGKLMNHTEIPSSPDTLRLLLARFASRNPPF